MFGLFARYLEVRNEVKQLSAAVDALRIRVNELSPEHIRTERLLIEQRLTEIVERVEEAVTRQKQKESAEKRWSESKQLKQMQMEILAQSLNAVHPSQAIPGNQSAPQSPNLSLFPADPQIIPSQSKVAAFR